MSDASTLHRLATRIEATEALDRPAALIAAAGRGRVDTPSARAVLGGRWLGHALHPLLTDFPLGSWMSASLLDLVGGPSSRTASRRLIGFGILASLPTAAAGLSDWMTADRGPRRVGVVHAGANVVSLALYTASWRARHRGRHAAGVGLGLLGGVASTVGGFFGGHLSLATDTALRSSATALGAETAAATPPSDATRSSSP